MFEREPAGINEGIDDGSLVNGLMGSIKSGRGGSNLIVIN